MTMTTHDPWRRLLVYLEDPQQESALLERAAGMAVALAAELDVLLVIDQRELMQFARAAQIDIAIATQRTDAHVRECLAPLLQALPCPARLRLRFGRPFLEILREVQSGQIDLLVKGSGPRQAWQRSPLCSLDQHLLRKCPSAVLLQPRESPMPGHGILASLDLAEAVDVSDPPLDALNARVVRAAARLARMEQQPLHLLHAWDAPAADMIRYWIDDAAADQHAHRYALRCEQQAASRLRAVQTAMGDALDGLHCQPVLRRGDARQVIVEQVETLHPALLVMGTVGRSHLAGLLIGNTAEDVLNAVHCPVLALKPDDFVCPIALNSPA